MKHLCVRKRNHKCKVIRDDEARAEKKSLSFCQFLSLKGQTNFGYYRVFPEDYSYMKTRLVVCKNHRFPLAEIRLLNVVVLDDPMEKYYKNAEDIIDGKPKGIYECIFIHLNDLIH